MLIATIHDVAPPTLAAVTSLRALLRRWGVETATLLAIPDHHGRAPLRASRPTRRFLASVPDEIALHGVTHRQDAPIPALRDRLRAAALTAGEGEMLGRGAAAPARLAAARAELQSLVDAPIAGFVAPAWLEPRHLAPTLRELGFAWHETAAAVTHLPTSRALRAPVIGFATRTPWRERASLLWAAALLPPLSLAARLRRAPIRLALHPADLSSPRVLAAAERVVRAALLLGPAVTTSRALELLRGAGPPAPASV